MTARILQEHGKAKIEPIEEMVQFARDGKRILTWRIIVSSEAGEILVSTLKTDEYKTLQHALSGEINQCRAALNRMSWTSERKRQIMALAWFVSSTRHSTQVNRGYYSAEQLVQVKGLSKLERDVADDILGEDLDKITQGEVQELLEPVVKRLLTETKT